MEMTAMWDAREAMMEASALATVSAQRTVTRPGAHAKLASMDQTAVRSAPGILSAVCVEARSKDSVSHRMVRLSASANPVSSGAAATSSAPCLRRASVVAVAPV